MQERVSDFVISFALFVVAAFWVWKHMKTDATTHKAGGISELRLKPPKGNPAIPLDFSARERRLLGVGQTEVHVQWNGAHLDRGLFAFLGVGIAPTLVVFSN